ncbi:MAG: NADH-quinone oxidoreductase subunit C [Campylobacterota bacterium]|nr:NADH-quinone oxidoreductase subunit C [Campylobacterota bacterium]
MFNQIKNNFATDDIIVKRNDLYKVTVVKERLFELIHMLRDEYDYKTLNAITCTDWIEEGHFALTYMMTALDRKNTFMIQTMINRETPHIKTLSLEFKQAQIMERDLAEMYGIDFVGNKNLKELSLENWVHTPPLRREFDSLEFVNNHLTFREGRDDGVDAKAETKRLRALKKAAKKAKEAKDGK